jgi:Uma2 family endonuclease
MANGIPLTTEPVEAPLPLLPDGMPIFYEDEDEGDMGEANLHVLSTDILYFGVQAHLAGRRGYRVFSNLNLHYRDGPPHRRTGALPYVSPDVMVVRPYRALAEDLASYAIGREGPAPVFVAEVLSERSAQQRDLREKLRIYALLGVSEYLLADVTGRFLPERRLLKRLRRDGTWKDEHDSGSGVTSRLGFCVILEDDGHLRVRDARTGKRYVRPTEAQAAADALAAETAKLRALEQELARLRAALPQEEPKEKKRGRRKKP